ncbi:MAG TPA: hypothetical protein VES65_11450 [Solirubrobacteraceae bacterium]|nr:hypothetical protein [Solirubrobacteraceae bacterium]
MSLKRRSGGTNDGVKVFEPQPLRLAHIDTDLGPLAPAPIYFRVPTADGRVQAKIAIVAAPDVSGQTGAPVPSIPFDVTFGGTVGVTLWMCTRECDEGSGLFLPMTNLVGTFATPQVLPFDSGLMVFSESVLSDGDDVFGMVTFTVAAGSEQQNPMNWLLNVKYTPVVEMSYEEWCRLVPTFNPELIGSTIIDLEPGGP